MSSDAWVFSHLFALSGFILVPLGIFALRNIVSSTRAERVAFAALVTTWIGPGLTLSYYGAEDFGLNAIARKAVEGQALDVVGLADAVRYTLLLSQRLRSACWLLARCSACRRGDLAIGCAARYSGIPFAIGFALFLPQFFTPPAVRIGHGVLVAAGLLWMALTVGKAKAQNKLERMTKPLPHLSLG